MIQIRSVSIVSLVTDVMLGQMHLHRLSSYDCAWEWSNFRNGSPWKPISEIVFVVIVEIVHNQTPTAPRTEHLQQLA